MKDNIYVCCHSPCLSMLLFESTSSQYDQVSEPIKEVGLLLGSIQKLTLVFKTDENEATDEEKTEIYIEHCVPFQELNTFDAYGESTVEAIQNICGISSRKIVGWYSFRRHNRKMRSSLRECLIHKWLLHSSLIAHPESFVFGLLSTSTREDLSTHSFRSVFLKLNENFKMLPVRFKVSSLSDTLGQISGYYGSRRHSESASFRSLVKKSYSSMEKQSNTESVERIHMLSSENLLELSKNLLQLEKEKRELENEVSALKQPTIRPPANPCYVPRSIENSNWPSIKFDTTADYQSGRSLNVPMEVSESDDGKLETCPCCPGDVCNCNISPQNVNNAPDEERSQPASSMGESSYYFGESCKKSCGESLPHHVIFGRGRGKLLVATRSAEIMQKTGESSGLSCASSLSLEAGKREHRNVRISPSKTPVSYPEASSLPLISGQFDKVSSEESKNESSRQDKPSTSDSRSWELSASGQTKVPLKPSVESSPSEDGTWTEVRGKSTRKSTNKSPKAQALDNEP